MAPRFTTLTFHRDGSADHSGTFYLHGPGLRPACKHCRAVAISRATGRVVWYTYAIRHLEASKLMSSIAAASPLIEILVAVVVLAIARRRRGPILGRRSRRP